MENYYYQHSTFTFDAHSDESNDDNCCYITYLSSDEFLATLTFTLQCYLDKWVRQEGASEDVFRGRVTLRFAFDVHLDRRQLFDFRHFMGTLSEKFCCWPLPQSRVVMLTGLALQKARSAYKAMPSSCNKILIHFPLTSVLTYLYDERRAIDLATQLSEEEEKMYMIPAAESAIESALKGVEVGAVSAEDDKCNICLEEMKGGCGAVVAIPCSHVFHEDCIRQWFRTSHYCPLCRYELPTY